VERSGGNDRAAANSIFIRQPYESESKNGFYGAFLYVSRLNPIKQFADGLGGSVRKLRGQEERLGGRSVGLDR